MKQIKIKDFDQTLVLEFLRQNTDLYDKDKENEFFEVLTEFLNDFIKEHDKRLIEEIEGEIKNTPIEFVGNSAKTQNQCLNIINKFKQL